MVHVPKLRSTVVLLSLISNLLEDSTFTITREVFLHKQAGFVRGVLFCNGKHVSP